MRICLVVENHPSVIIGGAQYQAHLLALELASRPHLEIHYLGRGVPTSHKAGTVPYGIRKIGTSRGIRRRAVIFDARRLYRTLEELRPDVIYQRMRQSYTAVCARYASRAGIPFIFHVAHEWDLEPNLLKQLRPTTNLPFDLVESALGNWGIARATRVIVQTQAQARLLRSRYDKEPAAVIGNFHELPTSLVVKPTSPVRVVWIANLKEFKRPEIFLDLATAFAERTDVEFVMVGRPNLHRRSRDLMARIRQSTHLRFLGELPIEEVNRLLETSHIFVNTSLWEGFPNTYVQAWSRGAVVTSLTVDVDGGMEQLGIGYCAGTVDRLIETIDLLIQNPSLRDAIAQRGFKYAQANHALANAARLADLITSSARRS